MIGTDGRDVRCHLAGLMLPGTERIGVLMAHRGSCLRCQATAARERRIDQGLRALVNVSVPVPKGLVPAVLDGIATSSAAADTPGRPGQLDWVRPAAAAVVGAVAVAMWKRLATPV